MKTLASVSPQVLLRASEFVNVIVQAENGTCK